MQCLASLPEPFTLVLGEPHAHQLLGVDSAYGAALSLLAAVVVFGVWRANR